MGEKNVQQEVSDDKKQQKKNLLKEFPGGPVVKTPCFQCRGRGFDPW